MKQRTLLNLGRHFEVAPADWPRLCQLIEDILAGQLLLSPDTPADLEDHAQRITATFRRDDGRTLHVRKATLAEPPQQAIYDALGIDSSPGGVRKTLV